MFSTASRLGRSCFQQNFGRWIFLAVPACSVKPRQTAYCYSPNLPRFFTTDYSHENDESDCPMCQEFERGPCRQYFRAWHECTKQHGDNHVDACASCFQEFHQCLEKHSKDDELHHTEDGSLESWQELVERELKDLERRDFRLPIEQEEISENYIKIGLPKEDLILAYVIADNKDVVVAGSVADLELSNDKASIAVPKFPGRDMHVVGVYDAKGLVFACRSKL